MPTPTEFQSVLEKFVAYACRCLPMNWRVIKVEALPGDHEHFLNAEPQIYAKNVIASGERTIEIYINKDHVRFQDANWDRALFGAVFHEIGHGVIYLYGEGLKASMTNRLRVAFDEYEDHWCDILCEIAMNFYPHVKKNFPQKGRSKP